MANQDDGEFHVYSGYYREKIVSGNYRHRWELCGNGVRMSCVHQDVTCDQFGVVAILMNDSCGKCGSREKKNSVANG